MNMEIEPPFLHGTEDNVQKENAWDGFQLNQRKTKECWNN